jgi:hypothetical protein
MGLFKAVIFCGKKTTQTFGIKFSRTAGYQGAMSEISNALSLRLEAK